MSLHLADDLMVLDLRSAPGYVEGDEMGARQSHILNLWIFECGHGIECGCRHKIGLNGFCIICDKPRKIVEFKTVDYHLARPRKREENAATTH
jgi:hypothetical protein